MRFQDAEPVSDLKTSLERLPLPNIAHDFQLPRAVFDAVRRMPNKPPSYCHIRRSILFLDEELYLLLIMLYVCFFHFAQVNLVRYFVLT